MPQCLIVDVTDYANWRHLAGRDVMPRPPSVMHVNRETANTEAMRLAKLHPQCTFAIFEAVALAISKKFPTHVTIGGAHIGERAIPYIAAFADDEVPF